MNIRPSFFRCLCIPGAIALAAAVAIFVLVAIPLRGKIAEESDDIQKFRAKVENAQRKISRLPELGTQFSVVKEDERKISRLLPETQAVDFIREVEETAREVGGEVTITQGSAVEKTKKASAAKKDAADAADAADPKKAAEPETIADGLSWEKRLPLKVTFSGEYGKAVNFLHKIETMAYRLDVIAVDIRPLVSEEGSRRAADAFAPAVTEGTEPAQLPPTEPERPAVTAVFDLVVYTE